MGVKSYDVLGIVVGMSIIIMWCSIWLFIQIKEFFDIDEETIKALDDE